MICLYIPLTFHLQGVPKNVTYRFSYASFLISLICILQCFFINTPNFDQAKQMKRGLENYFASLKGIQRNFGYWLKHLIQLSSILLIHELSSERIAARLNQSSKQVYTTSLP